MEAILLFACAIATAIAALAFTRFPTGVVIVCSLLLIVGSIALALLVYGPKDYLLRFPASLATVLHPYLLGLAGLLCVIVGVGGLAGSLARFLMHKSTTEG